MIIKFDKYFKNKQYDQFREEITNYLANFFYKIEKILSVDDNLQVQIERAIDSESLKELDGVGGFCNSANLIQISLDINNYNFDKTLETAITRTFIHELHHASRIRSGIEISKGTFLEQLLSEGLADNFVLEITGNLPIWTKSLSKKENKKLMTNVKAKLNKKLSDNDYEEWFIFGSKEKNIPKWAGYSLGYYLVQKLVENSKMQSSEMVRVPGQILYKELDI